MAHSFPTLRLSDLGSVAAGDFCLSRRPRSLFRTAVEAGGARCGTQPKVKESACDRCGGITVGAGAPADCNPCYVGRLHPMPTARTETTARKSASATAARAGGPLPGTSTQEFTTGTILAERYRDTAYESLVEIGRAHV